MRLVTDSDLIERQRIALSPPSNLLFCKGLHPKIEARCQAREMPEGIILVTLLKLSFIFKQRRMSLIEGRSRG